MQAPRMLTYNNINTTQRLVPTRAKQARLILPSAAEAKPKVKELNRMHGLDTYDYGARQYDPVICRWDRIDPLCEKYYSVSPYVYCANNPINLIDPDGRKPSYYEAKAMAMHVYGDQSDNILIGGWRPSTRIVCGVEYNNAKNGLTSKLYERVNSEGKVLEYVYAIAGTDGSIDAWQDIKQLQGDSEQYKLSKSNAEKISNDIGNQELTFVGHSLGGGEAAVDLLATASDNPQKRSAITFNAAGVSTATLKNMNLNKKYEYKITSYEMGADILSWGQRTSILPNALGKRVCIPEPFSLPNPNSHKISKF